MKKRFQDQPIYRKISLYIFGITAVLISALSIISLTIYSARNNNWYEQESYALASNAASSLNMHYEVITRRFVSIFGNSDFAALLLKERDEDNPSKMQQKDVQSYLADLQVSDYIIDSTMAFSNKTGSVFSYNWSSMQTTNALLDEADFSQIKGITWLSKRTSPLHKSTMTIPIVYPLSTDYKDYVTLTNNTAYADIFIIVYIDYDKLSSTLTSDDMEHRSTKSLEFFLYSTDRILLNPPDDLEYKLLADEKLNQLAPSKVSSDPSFENSKMDNFWYYSPVKNARLLLLYHTIPNSFFSAIGLNMNTLILLGVFIIVLLAIISMLMSRYISKPIRIQAEIVKEIEHGSYNNKKEFKTNDEIGQLNKAINQMYDTIQHQIEQIKKEESEKYVAQMLRTSEQVNPHFLYNTLDAIQSEVRIGNREHAADLIQYLSEYMRIGLSYGDDFITIPKELQHANAYIHLMEQRFGKDINFIYQVSPELSTFKMPKTILQPLLENSIRHGFGIDSEGIPVQLPTLEVNILSDRENLTIEVADNGSGFDTEKTAAIMINGKDDQQRHIGLHNVYYRFITTYGKDNIDIQLDSIPYYKNSIKIILKNYRNCNNLKGTV